MFAKTQVAIIYNLSFLSDKKTFEVRKELWNNLYGGRRFNTPFNLDSINVKSYRLQILQIFAIVFCSYFKPHIFWFIVSFIKKKIFFWKGLDIWSSNWCINDKYCITYVQICNWSLLTKLIYFSCHHIETSFWSFNQSFLF